MKKLLFLCVTMQMCICFSANAQVVFTDSVRYKLKGFLADKGESRYRDVIDTINFEIKSMLTKKEVTKLNQKGADVDLYEFKHVVGTGMYSHAMMVYYDKYHLIDMRKNYSDIIDDLLGYFKSNPEIDTRLLPKFTILISNLFMRNTLGHEKGQWQEFWDQKDSLSRQLNVQYKDWIWGY